MLSAAEKKSAQVYRWLLAYIDENKFSGNQRLPSENALCRKLGVSRETIRVAIDRPYTSKSTGERQADFINVVCWRQQAEFVSRYFHKGSMIIVEGRLQNSDYTDGNGVKHYSMEVQADNVTFGETRAAAQANGNYTAPSNQSGYQYQPQYQQQPSAPQAAPQQPAAAPASQQQNNSVPIQLGDLSDFEEILSDGEVPF